MDVHGETNGLGIFFLCVFGGSYHLQGVFKKKKKMTVDGRVEW